mgnify:CR=1 FL=1
MPMIEEQVKILRQAKESVAAYMLHKRKENMYASTKISQARDSILACLLAQTKQANELELLLMDKEQSCSERSSCFDDIMQLSMMS